MINTKYQYSNSDGNGGIFVVASDDKVQIELDKLWVDKLMGKAPISSPQSPAVTPAPIVDYGLKLCTVHQVDMKERTSKKTGKPYFAHYRKVDGEFDTCFGKGWLSEQQGTSSEDIGRNL